VADDCLSAIPLALGVVSHITPRSINTSRLRSPRRPRVATQHDVSAPHISVIRAAGFVTKKEA
jgi:hypothetical protein